MQKKAFSFAVGALLFSVGAVSAATLTDNLNLRNGPGLRYDVVGAGSGRVRCARDELRRILVPRGVE